MFQTATLATIEATTFSRTVPAAVPAPERKPRRKKETEDMEYHNFAQRVLKGYARRAAGNPDTMADFLTLAKDLQGCIDSAVQGLRAENWSWGEIARRMGMTRQAAQQRWGGK